MPANSSLYTQLLKHWKVCIFLIFIYCIYIIPSSFFVFKYSDIVSTLQHIYTAQGMFQGFFINPQIENSIITPSNLVFIFTPAIYYLSNLFTNLSNIFIFTHFFNIIFVILFYILLRKKCSVQLGIIFSLIVIFKSVNTQFFAPDYIVQPLMVICLLLFIDKEKVNLPKLFLIGFLCGLIFIFKQNFGLFFLVAIGTGIFFRSLLKERKFNLFSNIIVLIYFLFGLYFIFRTNFTLNYIYFLFPYFLFWFFSFYLINSSFNLNNNQYIKHSLVLLCGFSLLPFLIILNIGFVVGYEKYLFSIFGMGWDYLPFWEYNIYDMVNHLKFRNNNEIFISLTIIFSVLLPFAINLLTSSRILFLNKNSDEFLEYLTISSIGVICIFLLFPFEDFKIANTKIFIYLFIFGYFFSYIKFYLKYYLLTSLFVFFIFLQTFYNFSKLSSIFVESDLVNNKNLQKVLNINVEKKLLSEINLISKFITTNINTEDFYLVSSDLKLIPFLFLNSQRTIQFYQRQDTLFFNKELSEAIKNDLQNMNYILSTKNEYNKYLFNNNILQKEKHIYQLHKYVNQNFDLYSSFKSPFPKSKFPELILLKRK